MRAVGRQGRGRDRLSRMGVEGGGGGEGGRGGEERGDGGVGKDGGHARMWGLGGETFTKVHRRPPCGLVVLPAALGVLPDDVSVHASARSGRQKRQRQDQCPPPQEAGLAQARAARAPEGGCPHGAWWGWEQSLLPTSYILFSLHN